MYCYISKNYFNKPKISNSSRRMDNKAYHMLVFTTKMKLNERFTRQKDRCVFILNNNDSSVLKDRDTSSACKSSDKPNLISDVMKTDEICSTNNEKNIDESEIKVILPLHMPTRRVQNDLNLDNFRSRYRSQSYSNLIDLTGPERMWNDQFPENRRFFPLRSRFRRYNANLPYRGIRKNYRTYKRYRVYSNRSTRPHVPNVSRPRKYRHTRPFYYRWGRRRELITKEQLDDELDKYMADVLFNSAAYNINKDKGDANENYLNETEMFLKNI